MRRVFSLLVSISLLIVSSVPMVSMAEICAPPAHETAMDEAMQGDYQHDSHDDAMKHEDVKHSMTLAGDRQKQRIECGCGCHRSIDSLPHLLAPHTVAVAQLQIEMLSAPIPVQLSPALISEALRIPVPPPQFS